MDEGLVQSGDTGRNLFEAIKKTNDHGATYWSAREIMPLLGYKQWKNFQKAISKAITSCETSGNDHDHHFAESGKVIAGGKGASQTVEDYCLSRFACYLVAQNGQSSKPEIANAQKYFAIQARRQEISDEHAADQERLGLRAQTSEAFRALSGAAKQAGVQSRMFGVFHDAGYKGLYGGMGANSIKRRKGIPDNEQLMDRMGATELAANQFRMTQAHDQITQEPNPNEQKTIAIHGKVGKEVREAIKRIRGQMPEDIPAEDHIKKVKKRVADAMPKMELDDADSRGLIGDQDIQIDDL